MKAHIFSVIVLITAGGILPLLGQNIDIVVTDICEGTSNGKITLEVLNGANPPFSIVWSNNDTEEIIAPTIEDTQAGESEITNLEAGIYCVEVISLMDGCTAQSCNLIVETTPPLQITESISCICPNGFGSIEVDITGGTPPYTQNWTDPNGNTVTNLNVLQVAGTYHLVVIDENGCEATELYTLNACSGDLYNATVTHSCEGPGTGSIIVDIIQNIQPPTIFLWTKDGEQYNSATIDHINGQTIADNLEAGEYTLSIFTANGCTSFEQWTIKESIGISEIDAIVSPVTNGNNGAIVLQNTNGNEYTYQWSNGVTSSANTNLSPGTYSVTISDASSLNLCTKILEFNVMDCEVLEAIVIANASAEVFIIGSNATIDLEIPETDGYNLQYEWSNGANTEDITVSAGTQSGEYCVDISINGCTWTYDVCAEVCNFGLKLRRTTIPNCDGVNVIADSGNFSDFSYDWSNGSTEQSIFFEYNTEYCVTVTDENNCKMSACLTIPYQHLTVSAIVTDAIFVNDSGQNGAIELIIAGGTEDYTIEWEDSNLSGSFVDNLYAGTYVVTVTDHCGDSQTLSILVNCIIEVEELIMCADITPVECNGSLGSIDIKEDCLNAEGPFKFIWDNGETSPYILDLEVGTYCVTVMDTDSECVVSTCFEVPQSNGVPFELLITSSGESCYGGNNNTLQVEINDGGVGPFTYEWSEIHFTYPFLTVIGNNPTVENASAGVWYKVIVTDANGCSNSTVHQIFPSTSNLEVFLEINSTPNCSNTPTYVEAIVTGGSGFYAFEWYDGNQPLSNANWNQVTIYNEGAYYVRVIDNVSGCIKVISFKVEKFPPMSVGAKITHICNPGNQQGIVELSVSGNQPFSYNWSSGSTFKNIYSDIAGTFTVTVTDANGCTFSDDYTIEELSSPIQLSLGTITPVNCTNSFDGSIEVEIIGGSPTYTLVVKNITSGEDYSQYVNESNITLANLDLGIYEMFVEKDAETVCESEVVTFEIPAASEAGNPIDIIFDSFPYDDDGIDDFYFHPVGGTAPYEVYWITNPSDEPCYYGGFFQIMEARSGNSSPVTDLRRCDVSITIIVTDDRGCEYTEIVPICPTLPTDFHAFFNPAETVSCENGAGAINGLTIYRIASNGNRVTLNNDDFIINWSGPNNFSSTGNFINNLSDSGEYCAEITLLGCYEDTYTITRCVTLSCSPCNVNATFEADDCYDTDTPWPNGTNHGHLKLKTVNPTNNLYLLEWSDGDKGLIRVGDNPNNISNQVSSSNSPELSDLITYLDNTVAINKTELGPGILFGEVTSLSGCSDVGYVNVSNGDQCIYQLKTGFPFDPSSVCNAQEEIDFQTYQSTITNSPYSINEFIGSCYRWNPCSDVTETGPIIFIPNTGANSDSPCESGGTINCQLCSSGDFITMIVPPNRGRTVKIGSDEDEDETCGCIFEPGSIIDPQFVNAAFDGGITNPLELPVVAFMECNNESNPLIFCETENINVSIVITGSGPVIDVGMFCETNEFCLDEGQGGCIQEINEELCNYEIFCQDGTGPHAVNSAYWYCYLTTTDGYCGVAEQCQINPCDFFVPSLFSAGSNSLTFSYDGILPYLNYPELFPEDFCFEGECENCLQLSQSLPPCLSCSGEPIFPLITNPNNNNEVVAKESIRYKSKVKDDPEGKVPLDVSFYPNPFKNNIEIQVNTHEESGSGIVISIYSLLGNNVFTKEYQVVSGNNNFEIQLNIPNGVYQIIVTDENGNYSTQRIVRATN